MKIWYLNLCALCASVVNIQVWERRVSKILELRWLGW